MARGGRRAGRTGALYSNRTDLNVNKPLPIQTATGQTYGMATQQRQAQQAVPLAPQPVATPPAPLTGGISPTAPSVLPGELPPLTGPSMRPNEHVSTGLPVGPGPGPGILGQPPNNAKDLLDQLAATPYASPEIRRLANYLNGGRV